MGRVFVALAVFTGGCSLVTTLGDLAGDGGADVASGRTTFCESVDATFCEDFDEPDGDYVSRWTSSSVANSNTLALEQDAAISPPNALFAQVPYGVANQPAALWKDLASDVKSIEYAFDVRFEPYAVDAGSVSFAEIVVATADGGPPSTAFDFVMLANATHVQARVTYADGDAGLGDILLGSSNFKTFAAGKWYHVDETITLSGTATINLVIDGQVILGNQMIKQATNGVGASAKFLVGIERTTGTTGPWAMEIDNVVVRAQ